MGTGVMRVEGETGDLSSSGAASAAKGRKEHYNGPQTRQGWDVGDRDRKVSQRARKERE